MYAKKILAILSLAAVLLLSACENAAETSKNITPTETPVQTSDSSRPAPEETPAPENTPAENASGSSGIITGGEPADRAGMTKTYSAAYDINSDGIEENISLYIGAETDKNGILMLEDSNRWIFEVNDGISSYTLFDSNISHGSLYAEISEYYGADGGEIPVLSLIKSTGAGLNITNYTYNKDGGGFLKSEIFSTDTLSPNGVNRISSSLPEPEALQKE